MLKNIFIVIEYSGKNYAGWQKQLNGVGIQDVIEKAIFDLTGQVIKINGSGRTDAEVNAKGQTASFRIDCTIPPENFYMALNSVLPKDIRILSSQEADMGFHARYSAIGKHYRYTICNREISSAIYAHSTGHIKYHLDIDQMRRAGGYFIGQHDFRSFMSSGSTIKDTVRTIYRLEINKDGPLVYIDVWGSGFLYNMVRIMAGTLVDAGRGALNPDKVKDIIESKNRDQAGITLKACGLCLMEVFYDEGSLFTNC
jgi:tRNA pseudouridine38-40 synthase